MIKMAASLAISATTCCAALFRQCRRSHLTFSRFMSFQKTVKSVLELDPHGASSKLKIKGWLRSIREHREIVFLGVVDGSTQQPLQVVASPDLLSGHAVQFGASVEVEGELMPSSHKGQQVELQASHIKVMGSCDPVEFPFKARKHHSVDYIREFPHLRPRTNSFSALLRVRNAATMAIHKYFQEHNYCFIHTPILTSSDCEGAGEVFQVEPAKSKTDSKTADERQHESADKGFFKMPTYLTVSGQLHLEAISGAFTRVYNFGPTFRAENSRGRHHLAEFYMVEAEVAFTESLADITQVMEGLVKSSIADILTACGSDVDLFLDRVAPKEHRTHLSTVLESEFKSITYTEAVELLQKYNSEFQYSVTWGGDLLKEHEKFLTTHFGCVPIFVTDYPKELKPFYARDNKDGQTVGAVDLLVPGVGELCGGSLREERLDILSSKLQHLGMTHSYQWYLDLRRFGTVPHGGFGLGFERFLQYLLGVSNIRDTIPFPRWSGSCKL